MKRIRGKVKRAFIPHAENEFQPSILRPRTLFILAVVLLLIKFLIFSWFFYFPKTAQFAIVTSTTLVELANKERVALGLQPLKVNQQLVQAAQQKAQDMLNNSYFAHISPDGITPWYWLDKVGYNYLAAGENLAKDFTDSQFLHQAWMNSPSHKLNILKKNYQEIGIAVVEGRINNKTTVLAVQFFALSTPSSEAELLRRTGEVPTEVGTKVEHKEPAPPVAISDTNIELEPIVKSEPSVVPTDVVGTMEDKEVGLKEKPKSVLNIVTEKSESLVQKTYFIILGLLSLVLLLTIFVNIRVQHPKLIFTVLIFIVLIAAIALFNGQEFLNQGIDII